MEKMIKSLANSFHQTTGIEFRELNAEANLAYCEALLSYNPDKKVKLSTWVFTCVKNALINFCTKEHKAKFYNKTISIDFFYDLEEHCENPFAVPDELVSENPEPWQVMQQEFRGLARKVVDIVLEADNFVGCPKDMRGQVVEQLRDAGFSWPKVWQGMREVKMVLN